MSPGLAAELATSLPAWPANPSGATASASTEQVREPYARFASRTTAVDAILSLGAKLLKRRSVALHVVALRRSITEFVGRITSPIVVNGWNGRYWR